MTIQVSVVAPNKKNSEFQGYLKIENQDNLTDFDLIPVNLKTSKNKVFNFNYKLLEYLFERYPNLFPILQKIIQRMELQ